MANDSCCLFQGLNKSSCGVYLAYFTSSSQRSKLYLFTYMPTNTGILCHWSFFRQGIPVAHFKGPREKCTSQDVLPFTNTQETSVTSSLLLYQSTGNKPTLALSPFITLQTVCVFMMSNTQVIIGQVRLKLHALTIDICNLYLYSLLVIMCLLRLAPKDLLLLAIMCLLRPAPN